MGQIVDRDLLSLGGHLSLTMEVQRTVFALSYVPVEVLLPALESLRSHRTIVHAVDSARDWSGSTP
jgi:hypothetical protein